MKTYIYLVITLLLSITSVTAQISSDNKAKWEQANQHYTAGEYAEAIVLYEELLGGDEHSEELYYNLGNAYFKNNNIGKAILNFNKALLLNPGSEDIQHNLAVANARTIDKIEPVPQFFASRWLSELGGSFGADTWSVLALILLAISLAGVVVWLVLPSLGLRKIGFYTAIVALILSITSFMYAQSGYLKMTSSSAAIITNSAAPVKSAPDASGKDLFLLHEGTKVFIQNTQNDWSEIKLEDGNKGWIMTAALEKIQLK